MNTTLRQADAGGGGLDSPTETMRLPPAAGGAHPAPALFLPPGQLTLLIGDPGTGKSLLSLDIAARITQGQCMPSIVVATSEAATKPTVIGDGEDANRPRCSVLVYSAEDTQITIAQRCLAAGGDISRLLMLKSSVRLSAPADGEPAAIGNDSSPAAAHTLLDYLEYFRQIGRIPGLLIIDPLPALLGTADCYHAARLRVTLAPLLEFALAHDLPILAITHLAKPTCKNKNPLHRIIGSLAYSALARAIYHVTPDPRDADRRLVIPLKHNLAAITHAFSFTLQSLVEEPPPGMDEPSLSTGERPPTAHMIPRIVWDPEPIPHSPGNPLSEEADAVARSQLEFAADFLLTTLDEGPMLSSELLGKARRLAISTATLARAKYFLDITSHYDQERKQWMTGLPPGRAGGPLRE